MVVILKLIYKIITILGNRVSVENNNVILTFIWNREVSK